MASSRLFNHLNPVCFPSSFDENRGRSKAQMHLKRIIDFISSFRSSSMNLKLESVMKGQTQETELLGCRKRGLDIDLNLRLGPSEEEESEKWNTGLTAWSGVGEGDGGFCGITTVKSCLVGDVLTVEKSSEGECDPKEMVNSSVGSWVNEMVRQEEREFVEEEGRELSGITNLHVQSSEIETKISRISEVEQKKIETKISRISEVEQKKIESEGEKPEEEKKSKGGENQGYLGMLIEVLIAKGDLKEDKEEEPAEEGSRCGSKRDSSWMKNFYEDFEDISPFVRSKRGRNQVLPYRYRDSVVEPLERSSQVRVFRQRSSRVSGKSKANK